MLRVRHRLYELLPFTRRDLPEEQHGVHVAAVIGLWWGELWAGVHRRGAAEIQQLVKASLKPLWIRVPTVAGLRSVVMCLSSQMPYVSVVVISSSTKTHFD